MLLLVALCAAGAACGKKGPPLPPLRRVPAAVGELAANRFADDVYVRFTVPTANVEGPGSANLSRVEVYAITTSEPLTAEDAESPAIRGLATRLASERVRPPLPPVPPTEAGQPAPPPPPLEPGLDQGAPVVVHDVLTGAALAPVEIRTPLPAVPAGDSEDRVPGPLVAPATAPALKRYYFAVGVTPSGRFGAIAAPVAVPLGPTTSAPASVDVQYDEKAFTVAWKPSPDARLTAAAEPADGLLPSRPIVAPPAPTKYDVYAADGAESGATAAPTPLNPAPLATAELVVPGVAFGRERCFVVRPVDVVDGLVVRGPASAPACVTPVDTFAPAPPRNLQAVAGAGTISLIWEANSEPDLAGYIVLRGEAPGEPLTPLTPAPIQDPRFDDTTVQPGTRYVYAVVAVDNAPRPNRSEPSNRAEETAR